MRIVLAHALPVLLIVLLALPAAAAHTDCSDGIDNDRDGRIDYPQDEKCVSLEDDSEGSSGQGFFLEVTDGKDTAKPGESLLYRITLRSDREQMQDITVRFHMPHQTNLREASNGGRVIGTYVQWDKVTVGGGQSRSLYLTIEVNPYAKENLLLVAEVEADGERDTDTTRVVDSPVGLASPLQITVTDGRQTAAPDEELTYTIVVRNTGASDRNYTLRTQIPVELALISASDAYTLLGRSLIWSNQTLAGGESKTYTVIARIEDNLPGFYHLRLRVYGNAGELAMDDTFIHVGPLEQEFTIDVDADAEEVAPSDEITYTITVRSRSDALATSVNVIDALPIYTEFVSATEGGRFTGGNEVRWDGLTIAPHGTRMLQVVARVRSDAPQNATLMNSAVVRGIQGTVASTVGDSTGEAPRRSETDLENVLLRKVADRPEVRPGDAITYTIIVRNTTGKTIHNVEVDDRLDDRYMTLVRGAEDAHQQGNHLVWTIDELEAGEVWQRRYTVTISADAPEGVTLNNVVSVGGDDIASLSLTERVRTTELPVFRGMPPTGAGLDTIVAMLSVLLSAGPVVFQRKRILG